MIVISNNDVAEGNHTFAYTITRNTGIRKICLPHLHFPTVQNTLKKKNCRMGTSKELKIHYGLTRETL